MREPRLVSEIINVFGLSERDKESMYSLMIAHYENVNRLQFEFDLLEKTAVILLRDSKDGRLCGFSTQKVIHFTVDNRPVRALFSGDTIISPSYWGEQGLGRAWCQFASEVRAGEPGKPLYWFLISKGYRTYLYLPLFFHQFYPRYDRPTPLEEEKILDTLAFTRYPEHYNRSRGLIVFPESHGHLNRELSEIPESRLRNPHVRYFLERNPTYGQGTELACVAEISAENMKSYAARAMCQGARELPREPSIAYA
jgi:hypothetical protein